MKNLLLILLIGGALIPSTSCNKEYTCECRDKVTDSVEYSTTSKSTQSKAKTWCEGINITQASLDVNCKLK